MPAGADRHEPHWLIPSAIIWIVDLCGMQIKPAQFSSPCVSIPPWKSLRRNVQKSVGRCRFPPMHRTKVGRGAKAINMQQLSKTGLKPFKLSSIVTGH
jgi:hypothetical protein